MVLIEEYIQKPIAERQKHLDLSQPCIERGGRSYASVVAKGILAHVLNTTIPTGMKVYCCHACNNAKCHNPYHVYFGTAKENVADQIQAGVYFGKNKSPG